MARDAPFVTFRSFLGPLQYEWPQLLAKLTLSFKNRHISELCRSFKIFRDFTADARITKLARFPKAPTTDPSVG